MPFICASADMQVSCPAVCITKDTQVGYQAAHCTMSVAELKLSALQSCQIPSDGSWPEGLASWAVHLQTAQ